MSHLNVVFLGHVDAGKSSLCGTILVESRMVDERRVSQVEKEAEESAGKGWGKAFLLDTDPEERKRGKTVEFAREPFVWNNRNFTILDAPGHRNFIPNAIEGLANADVCVLVVSARKGEFEAGMSMREEAEGQTREHALLAKAFGVSFLIVFVNKMDQVGWDKERYDEIKTETSKFLKKIGYSNKTFLFIPGSGLSSQNISMAYRIGWWDGPCLLEALCGIETRKNTESPLTRISVMSSLGKSQLFGKVERGRIVIGQTLTLCPGNKPLQVLSISTDFSSAEKAEAGENIFLSFSCEETPKQGDFLCSENSSIQKCERMLAMVQVFESTPLFCPGTECVMQLHMSKYDCNVEKIISLADGSKKNRCLLVRKGEIAKVALNVKALAEPFESFSKLGRFVLRDKGKTIAIGKVLRVA
ncbi:putative translation elongation factor 1-alpha [Brazilian marseillevirus]|uniref:translation elongation factor n=1 Tax=Brazilian marseillevirus TaxID=1813599 RepID=UPI0007831902|nr:translation elongation factor [Brazilian marseillevirus]AMQ10670.1 putative translation elongation factor 1-alpha [Brazilian marseillevirus]